MRVNRTIDVMNNKCLLTFFGTITTGWNSAYREKEEKLEQGRECAHHLVPTHKWKFITRIKKINENGVQRACHKEAEKPNTNNEGGACLWSTNKVKLPVL